MFIVSLLFAVYMLFQVDGHKIPSANNCNTITTDNYPRQYISYFTSTPPIIDGNINEPVWNEVPFTENFVDISTNVVPKFITKAKIRWDNEWLYVAGHVEEPAIWANITSTCHCLNNSQDQVIFHDNDFEVFVDTDGSTHNYKEFEMNAANGTWDLLLNKPYEDGGYENSSRVDGSQGWDMVPPLRSAVRVDGVLNDPSASNNKWTVEVAFPLSKLAEFKPTTNVPPKNKDYWRINFSRVEWSVIVKNGVYWKEPSCQSCPNPGTAVEDNWVWSPMGAIAMHRPELWGFLQFSTAAPGKDTKVVNPEWPARFAAHVLYYAQHGYAAANNNTYTSSIEALLPYAEYPSVLQGVCTGAPVIQTKVVNGTWGFRAEIPSKEVHGMVVAITDDRLMSVKH
eukprot:PhF_6_TR9717/c0_g1_i1/m.14955